MNPNYYDTQDELVREAEVELQLQGYTDLGYNPTENEDFIPPKVNE